MKQEKKQNKKDRHRLRNGMLVVLSLVILGGGMVLTLTAHRPGKYKPAVPENPEVVSPYLTHELAPEFYNQVQLDRPFELAVDQAGLNDILSRGKWPMQFGELTLSMPTVLFGEGQITLMAEVDYNGLSAVVSLIMLPEIDEAGMLNLNIQTVYLGAMPITPLAQLATRNIASQYLPTSAEQANPIKKIINAILSNQPFEPVLTIQEYTMRLEELILEDGRCRIFLVPVPVID